MSAWIVSQNHIRLLVEAMYKHELVSDDTMTPDALGALLWKENHRSINYRYNTRTRTPQYRHDSMAVAAWSYPSDGAGIIRDLVRNPALVYKQARCYEYQSCERPDWDDSEAHALSCKLTAYLESRYSDHLDNNHPWGIS